MNSEKSNPIVELSFQFATDIVRFCYHLEQSGSIGRTISWQLIRSGTSIGANVEEAQAGQSKADFIAKLSISRKEARETIYWLRLLVATGIYSTEELESLKKEADDLLRILTAIIKSSRSSPHIRH